VAGLHSCLFQVRRFQEKPAFQVAEHLFKTGSLWNTFVMVGHVGTFLKLAFESVPELIEALRSVQLRPAVGGEARIADWLYDRISPTDLSGHALTPGIARLVSMGLGSIAWNDLGDPERVNATLAKRDMDLPAWARLWQSKQKAELTEKDMSASSAVA
jgi:mannose-1-phosphate guanylyltransferase